MLGCGDQYVRVEPVPEISGAEALLIAAYDPLGTRVTVHSADEDQIQISADPERGAIQRLEALAYPGPLRDLGFELGPLRTAGPGEPGWTLPEPLATYSAVPPGDPVRWTLVDAPSAALLEQEYALKPPCRSFSSKNIPIDESLFSNPGKAIVLAAAAVPNDEYLVYVGSNGYGRSTLLVDRDGASVVPGCPRAARSALGDGTGDLWVGADTGLEHLHFDVATSSCALLETAPFPEPGSPRWIAGRMEPPTELYLLLSDGRVFRYDGQVLSEILRLPTPDPDATSHRGGVVYFGPDEGIAVSIGGDTVTLWNEASGERRITILPRIASDQLHTLRHVDGIGLLASYNLGSLFRIDPDTLSYELFAQTLGKPDSFEAYDSGMVVLADATLVQYYPAFGFVCPEHNISRAAASRFLFVETDGALFLPGSVQNQGSDPAEIVWLFPN